MTVGDDLGDNGIRAFLSFDISRIENVADFREATLTITTIDKGGNPWEGLGSLVVEEVAYGDRELEDDDYAMSGTAIATYTASPGEIDVTSLVAAAVKAGADRFQVSVRFENDTNENRFPTTCR